MTEFSVILPIYHQADQLEELIQQYVSGLKKLRSSFEIILVINGNDSASHTVGKKLLQKYPMVQIIFLKRSGWGLAVKTGIEHAKGNYICYTNSARTQISDLIAILKLAKHNPHVVIKATRILHINLLRRLGSTLYNIECRLLLHTPVWDVNGTPKVFPRKVAKKITFVSENDLIDAEFIAKCIWSAIPILEVPILFPERYGGKSTTKIFSAIKMYVGLFKIRRILKNSFSHKKF